MTAGRPVDVPTPTIDSYLRELGADLRGPGQWRRRVLAETEDGLRADLAAGRHSEDDVVREWGPVRLIAAEFNAAGRQLRARHLARRIIQLMLPAIPCWALVVFLSPDPWAHEPTLVKWFAPLLYISVVAAVSGAAMLIRRPGERTVNLPAVVCACTGTGTATVSIVVLLVYRMLAANGQMFWPALVVSAVLTLALVALVAGDAAHLCRSATRSVRRAA